MGVWKKTQCNFCAATCGIEMEIEDNKIINVRPDKDSPKSKGYCCRKGRSAKFYQDHGDRIDYPMKKVGDHFERISWEQAIQEIASKTKEIKKEYGPRSFAMLGCGSSGTQGDAPFAYSFMAGLGTQYIYNPIGIEFMGNWWSHGKIFGDQLFYTEPDEENCELFILWGSNSYVSHNLNTARRHIRNVSRDPNRMLITIDPRLSESARMSDMHIMPRPGSDSLLLRALIALIIKNDWQDHEYIKKYVKDFEKILPWFEDVDIEKSFQVCGVPYEQMEEFARLLTTKKWGCHQDLGLFFGRHNTFSSYLVTMLEVICGVALMPGGCIMDEVCIAKGSTTNEKDPKVWRTVETNRFPVLGIYPETVFPKEVLNDNLERLRAAFVSLTNPARSYPDSSRMREALKALDLLVVIEVAMTETAKEADYILPAKNSYETYDFNTFAMTYPEIVCHLRHPILDSVGERKEGAEIWLEIAEAVGVLPKLPQFIYDAAKKAVQTGDRIPFFLKLAVYVFLNRIDMKLMPALIGQTLGREMGSPVRSVMWAGLLTSPLVGTGQVERAGIKPSNRHKILNKIPILKDFCLMDAAFELVDERPEGAVIGITGKDDMIKRRVKHKDHLIHLYCDEINEYMDRITPEKEEAELTLNKEYPMLISSGRHSDEGCNTIMRNPAAYAYRKSCTVTMNPADAKNMGFVNDQQVRIVTKAGEMTATVEITYTMSPGYCMVPHYFGLEFEGKTVGCGANEIVSENDLDEITGNPYLRYIPCRIEAL